MKAKTNFTTTFDDDIRLKKSYLPVLYKRSEYKELKYWHNYYQLNLECCISQLQKIENYEQYFYCEDLTVQDYIFAILIGFCGSLITTDEDLKNFLKLFHNRPKTAIGESANELQKTVKKKLEHKGDFIDHGFGNIGRGFINREGGVEGAQFHRLMYGHDILSFKGDNPFVLAIKQYGFLDGIKKALIHLVADTCSAEGLPIPFSSFFDFTDGEELSNKLIACSTAINKSKKLEVFENLFTIHQTEILAQGATITLQELYLKACGFETIKAKDIFRIIVNICNFIITGVIESIKSVSRIPKINWVSLYNMIIPCGSLIGVKFKEVKIKKIENKYTKNSIQIQNNKTRIYKIYKINYSIWGLLFIICSFIFMHLVRNLDNESTEYGNIMKYELKKEVSSCRLDSDFYAPEEYNYFTNKNYNELCIVSTSKLLDELPKKELNEIKKYNKHSWNMNRELSDVEVYILSRYMTTISNAIYCGEIPCKINDSDDFILLPEDKSQIKKITDIDSEAIYNFSKNIRENMDKYLKYSVPTKEDQKRKKLGYISMYNYDNLPKDYFLNGVFGQLNPKYKSVESNREIFEQQWINDLLDAGLIICDNQYETVEWITVTYENGKKQTKYLIRYDYSLWLQDFFENNNIGKKVILERLNKVFED